MVWYLLYFFSGYSRPRKGQNCFTEADLDLGHWQFSSGHRWSNATQTWSKDVCVCVCVCVCVPAQWLSHFRLLGTPQTAAFQARVLKWVAMPSFRGSSWCRDQTLSRVSLALQVDSLSLCGSSLSPRAMVMLPGGAALWIKAVADRPGWGGGCGMHKTREIVPYLRIVEKRKEFPGWGWGRTLRSCSLGDGI